MTEETCRREAAARAPAARLLEHENAFQACPTLQNEELQVELRTLLTIEARNRAALQALELYFQLADADGRADLIRASLPVLDRLRATAHKAQAKGLRLPVNPDDLDRQRAAVLGMLSQADLGAVILDIELKRRIGYPGRGKERLRPQGPFSMSPEPVDVDAAIRTALERRADLQLLRTVYLRLTPDTLLPVREVLRNQPGATGLLGIGPAEPGRAPAVLAQRLLGRRSQWPDPASVAELEVRRHQLYDLIAERERQAADDVRSAAAALAAQTRQLGLVRWRIEQAQRKVADAAGQGPLVVLPAEMELYQARADGIAAVMAWHQARVRLAAAQGLLADEPIPSGGR